MKNISILSLLLVLLLIACTEEKQEVTAKEESKKVLLEEPEVELATYMANMQRYLEKMYWSAKANNEPLHQFYLHELEEQMESVQEAGITEDGVNVSYNMLHYGIKSLEVYEGRVKEEGLTSYPGHFKNLINGCNACHMVSKKPFVVIKTPELNIYSSQSFEP